MTQLRAGQLVEVDAADGERAALYRVITPYKAPSLLKNGSYYLAKMRRFKDGRWLRETLVQIKRVGRVLERKDYRPDALPKAAPIRRILEQARKQNAAGS